MSDQTSIFGNESPQATPAQTNNVQVSNPVTSSSNDSIVTALASIKNERGEQKYKTLEDALVALRHSQEYIPQLTTQLSQREQELERAKAEALRIKELEEAVRSLTQPNTTPVTTPPALASEEQIAEVVTRTLSQQTQKQRQQDNIATVVSSMKEALGDKAEEVYNRRAQELGMPVEELNALAAKSPIAALELIGVKKSANVASPSATPPTSSINSGAFAPNQQSFVGRNQKTALVGATSQDLMGEAKLARQMVDELHSQGKSVYDLTDPKVYASVFLK